MEVRLNYRESKLYTDLAPLIEQALEVTELTANSDASDETLTVKDIDGFAVGDILIIGELGTESCEIVVVHAATAPTGSTITLVSGGVEHAHAAGEKVYSVNFNQIELSHSATAGGSKSVLATVAIQADEREQAYQETAQSSGFYFARFKNTVTTTYSSYSPAVAFGGYGDNTVGYAINFALHRNGMKTYDDEVTRLFCIEEVNDMLQEWQGKLKRWPEYFKENADIGDLTAGVPTVTLPTDMYDTDSNQSLIAVRVGSGAKINWYDPVEFEERKAGDTQTQVASEASANDTTFTVDNAGDFSASGALSFFVSGVAYNITYSSVNKSTGVFSGVPASGDGSISITVPVDTYVYQGVSFGEPTAYTVRNGVIELDPIPNVSFHNKNIYGDYWTVATAVDDEGDTLDVKRFHAVKYWLAWKVRMQKKNDGMLDFQDGFYLKFRERLNDGIRTSPKVMTFKSRPFRRWGVSD